MGIKDFFLGMLVSLASTTIFEEVSGGVSFLNYLNGKFSIPPWAVISLLFALMLLLLIYHFKKSIMRVLKEFEWLDSPYSSHTFAYVISRPHNLALVEGIRLKAINVKNSKLFIKEAYLRSLVSGEKIEGSIERLSALDVEVSERENFTLLFSFPNEDGELANNTISGITFDHFLQRFSNFEIVITTNKKNHVTVFNSDVTKEWVYSIQNGLMMPAPAQKAKVLKKVPSKGA